MPRAIWNRSKCLSYVSPEALVSYVYEWVYACIYTCICICVCKHTCMCMCMCMYICICTCIYTWKHISTKTKRLYTHVYICMDVVSDSTYRKIANAPALTYTTKAWTYPFGANLLRPQPNKQLYASTSDVFRYNYIYRHSRTTTHIPLPWLHTWCAELPKALAPRRTARGCGQREPPGRWQKQTGTLAFFWDAVCIRMYKWLYTHACKAYTQKPSFLGSRLCVCVYIYTHTYRHTT